ncbi:MAG: hypothetical protein JWN76_2379 [Chitinophagaceae bacterium]|nr:hypothetical protein [Chitinophagaceae bacterium]
MNNMKIFLAVLGLFVYQCQTFSQASNYTGTWVLNLEKSKLEFPPKGLTTSIFIIKQEGDKFALTRYHIFGDKKNKISFKMMADGKTRRVKILFKGKLERKGNNLQATLWRKNFLNIVTYKFGHNHNEFIADEVFTGRPNNHHSIWVFDREVPGTQNSLIKK